MLLSRKNLWHTLNSILNTPLYRIQSKLTFTIHAYVSQILWNATHKNIVQIPLVGFYLQDTKHLLLFQHSVAFHTENSHMIYTVRGKHRIGC